ncbi:zinc-binding dehydrogenase [Burkholderia cepacia]|uniref:zinc-binding dehydrogenase n=1 Tax=Burkholderia cepacia TaxID=292 RepID=UPI0026DF469B|nr:zinc-binding dehydrogenase [Burkholderia cepacia]MDO5948322.1 zinc-binding dehydrogenase [Burkholderia cepacia]
MNKIVQFSTIGDPTVLQLVSAPQSVLAKDEVRIKVFAIGLNRADVAFRAGQYLVQPVLPSRVGFEAAGIVSEVGESVREINVGSNVAVLPNFDPTKYGTYGEEIVIPAASVITMDPRVPHAVAAASWMQYLTAYGGLTRATSIWPGAFVLLTAATSSVGLAAIQICNLLGAIPIAVTRNSEKSEALVRAGAPHVIATDSQDLVAEVQRITNGHGADIVFDPVAGEIVNSLGKR